MEYKKIQLKYYNTIKSVIKEVVKDVKDVGESFCYKFICGDIYAGDKFPDIFSSRNIKKGKIQWDENILSKTPAKSIDDKF
ncbi:hypothetical protein FP803_01710 [Candidatus Woesearchaeota archaeon]|nr:hypothetical protein [Candidatus Woesearchaeota archaeon]MBU3941621.1 hypothetical protein [Nanoarchaeota archaeon]